MDGDMNARVFFDAFAECLVNVGAARTRPGLRDNFRALSVSMIVGRHGEAHAAATGRMFDRLWRETKTPEPG